MLGVAVLGLGRIGPTHARVVSQADGVELKAVAEMDEAKLGSVVDGLPGVTGYGEYRDALARDDVQVVVICLPHWLREQAAMGAAEAASTSSLRSLSPSRWPGATESSRLPARTTSR